MSNQNNNGNIAQLASQQVIGSFSRAITITQSATDDASDVENDPDPDAEIVLDECARAFRESNPGGDALLANDDDANEFFTNVIENTYKNSQKESKEDVDQGSTYDRQESWDNASRAFNNYFSKKQKKKVKNDEVDDSEDEKKIAEEFVNDFGVVMRKRMANKHAGTEALSNEKQLSSEAKHNIEDLSDYIIDQSVSQMKDTVYARYDGDDNYEEEKREHEPADDGGDDDYVREGPLGRRRADGMMKRVVDFALEKPKMIEYRKRSEKNKPRIQEKIKQLAKEDKKPSINKANEENVTNKEEMEEGKNNDDDDDDHGKTKEGKNDDDADESKLNDELYDMETKGGTKGKTGKGKNDDDADESKLNDELYDMETKGGTKGKKGKGEGDEGGNGDGTNNEGKNKKPKKDEETKEGKNDEDDDHDEISKRIMEKTADNFHRQNDMYVGTKGGTAAGGINGSSSNNEHNNHNHYYGNDGGDGGDDGGDGDGNDGGGKDKKPKEDDDDYHYVEDGCE